MKSIRTFGLAALAALAAMAFAGSTAATASTVGLCGEESCPSYLSHVHETSVSKAKLLASPEVQCDVLFLGEVISPEGVDQLLVIDGNFTYTNCGAGCAVEERSGNSTIVVRKTASEKAAVIGEGEVQVNCMGLNCYYDGLGLEGSAKGASISTQENGEVAISEQDVHGVKGLFCPKTAKLDIVTTPLSPTYISN